MSDAVDVAVVGCGMFGAEIALRVRQSGLSVIVYESNTDILSGASRNNQNRLHLGFHYPRDMETGRQSIRGFGEFKTRYSASIESDFLNAYFIASEGSRTALPEYLAFCEQLGEPYERISVSGFPVEVTNAHPAILCGEVVYDCEILKQLVWRRIIDSGVDVAVSEKVCSLKRQDRGFLVRSERRSPVHARVVINTSYANNNLLTAELGYEPPERLFEYTVVPIVKAAIPKVGITIMDGSFMTVLPHGKSANFLLYNVEKTVVERSLSSRLDQTWLVSESSPFSRMDKEKYFQETIEMCCTYVPSLASAELVGFLEGPRMVLPRSEDTDGRPSIISEYGANYFTIFSGKIDHCMWIADEMCARLGPLF